ncbi:MAG: cold shock domain-containing protein [Candidatus Nanoarchaeia archaeon]|jgi:CspA family cold shock protein
MKGKIKALRTSFGFIKIENEEKDLFFHQTDVEGGEPAFRSLNEGDSVEFEKGSGDKGPKAIKVKKVEAEVEAE